MNTTDPDKGTDAESLGAGPSLRGSTEARPSISTRRGLLRAGLHSSPLILTLASRPVLAWH